MVWKIAISDSNEKVYVCECFSATKVFACYMNDWSGLHVKICDLSFIIYYIEADNRSGSEGRGLLI